MKRILSFSAILFLSLFFCSYFLPSNSEVEKINPVRLRLECPHIQRIAQSYLQHHIFYSDENEVISSRIPEQFIKIMDPYKKYFTQKDIKKIKKILKNSLEEIKKNDCSSIREAYNVLKKRLEQRLSFVKKALNSKFKLNKKTELTFAQKEYAKNLSQLNSYYSKYLHFQVANYIISGKSLEEAKQNTLRKYERLLRDVKGIYDFELWSIYLNAYSSSLDPHSSYLSVDDLEEFEIRMRLSLEGIGANLFYQDGFTVIDALVPGGAASRSGLLKVKDKIIAVAQGEKGAFESVIEMPLKDVVRKIRGKRGTKVRLTILRKSKKEGIKRFNISLVRDKIKLEEEAVDFTLLDPKQIGLKSKGKIGFISLNSFYADHRKGGRASSSDFKKILKHQVRKAKVDALVLDLTWNRGGTLEDAVQITGFFLKTGEIVKQSQKMSSSFVSLKDTDPHVYYNGPLVILVGQASASASEILAGALQDYKRAVIVGPNHTFGKGTVQSVRPLPRGFGAIKTTVGMFFIPSGKSTQRIGVSPDILLPSSFTYEEDEGFGEKTLDYALEPKTIASFISKEAYVKKKNSHWKGSYWRPIDAGLIQRLRKKSKARVEKSKEFKEIFQNIKKNKKKKKMVSVKDLFEEKESEEGKEEKMAKDTKAKKVDQNKKGKKDMKESFLSEKEKRKKKYFVSPEIKESIQIALDLVAELSSSSLTESSSHQKTSFSQSGL